MAKSSDEREAEYLKYLEKAWLHVLFSLPYNISTVWLLLALNRLCVDE